MEVRQLTGEYNGKIKACECMCACEMQDVIVNNAFKLFNANSLMVKKSGR